MTSLQITAFFLLSGLFRKGVKIQQLAWHETIGAAALLKHDGYYYLFVN